MNPLIQLKKATPVLLVGLVLACFALSPRAQAVSPAPDGGYAGGNTAEGQNALFSLTTGGYNTANGWNSLHTLSSGSFNTAFGAATLFANTGNQNTAIGAAVLLSNTTGFENTANGFDALAFNTVGHDNTANGVQALVNNTTGSGNTAHGVSALHNNITGGGNTAIGAEALEFNTTGVGNTALGVLAGNGVTTANNVTCIRASGADVSDSCFIGNIRGVTTSQNDATPVVIDSFGQLGTASSSRRYKKEIKPMDQTSEAILALKPVTFHYKSDSKDTPQFGLIAEEVEKVNPDLVVRDKEGKPYSVRYDQVNAMLLNEFLKEHRKVQEQDATIAQVKLTAAKQESTIAEQQKQIEALIAGLQKVSAQLAAASPSRGGLEASKPAPQVADNNQ